MPQTTGSVTINDTPTKSKLYHFCEKKIDKWIRFRFGQTKLLHDPSEPCSEACSEPCIFTVSFSESHEMGTRQVSCVTEIQLGSAHWRGYDLSNDTQLAFMQALKHLQPNKIN
jgi:hypothetical protein